MIPAAGTKIGGTFYANSELFVNAGAPGTQSPHAGANGTFPEFLLLVNDKDDNSNGWINEGFDGVDNDGVNGIDDIGEWEQEAWLSAPPPSAATQRLSPYTIRNAALRAARHRARDRAANKRRGRHDDAGDTRPELPRKSDHRFPVNPYTDGYVDILVNPATGPSVPDDTLLRRPRAPAWAGPFYHFWVAERSDVYAPSTAVQPPHPGVALAASLAGIPEPVPSRFNGCATQGGISFDHTRDAIHQRRV